ncbi:MAG: HAD family phosphatase [Solirubrobacterales bacterium]|nr:HAD family phosphatase [Solirubrobacterales bacterium]
MFVPRAVILDFNGTLSDDEPLLGRLLREALLEKAGVELTAEKFFGELSGLSDAEIIERTLRDAGIEPTAELEQTILRQKIDGYKEAAERELPISGDAAGFARTLADHVPVAIASGAPREEVAFVLELADLTETFCAVVCLDDVSRGKPDPEGYQLALAKLNGGRALTRSIVARETLAVEDSPPGVAAAKSAGLGCAAVPGDDRTMADADFVIDRLDPAAAEALLGRLG